MAPTIPGCELPRVELVHPKARREPFDDPSGAWVFDFKYDGFRGVLHKAGTRAWFCSKQGNEMTRFAAFAATAAKRVRATCAILDGEIVVLDSSERPVFSEMLRRNVARSYVAFDLLWLDGEDLRPLPLRERRARLLQILPKRSPLVKPAVSVAKHGVAMFRFMCEHDLEGIVAKRLSDPYRKRTKWYKIKNLRYSQALGRSATFNRRRP